VQLVLKVLLHRAEPVQPAPLAKPEIPVTPAQLEHWDTVVRKE
jgi:hypothetical protein